MGASWWGTLEGTIKMVGCEELLAQPPVAGAKALDLGPDRARVIHLAQMRELVAHDVIDEMRRRLHQAPGEAYLAPGVAASPARARRGDGDSRRRDAARAREPGHASLEMLAGGALVPRHHGAAHPCRRRLAQADLKLDSDALDDIS